MSSGRSAPFDILPKRFATSWLCNPSSRLADQIFRITHISYRVLALDFRLKDFHFRVVSGYAPHAGYPKHSLTQFYSDMHVSVSENLPMIVCADFNAQLHNGTMRSDMLMNFAAEHDMYIASDVPDAWEKTWTFQILWAFSAKSITRCAVPA